MGRQCHALFNFNGLHNFPGNRLPIIHNSLRSADTEDEDMSFHQGILYIIVFPDCRTLSDNTLGLRNGGREFKDDILPVINFLNIFIQEFYTIKQIGNIAFIKGLNQFKVGGLPLGH